MEQDQKGSSAQREEYKLVVNRLLESEEQRVAAVLAKGELEREVASLRASLAAKRPASPRSAQTELAAPNSSKRPASPLSGVGEREDLQDILKTLTREKTSLRKALSRAMEEASKLRARVASLESAYRSSEAERERISVEFTELAMFGRERDEQMANMRTRFRNLKQSVVEVGDFMYMRSAIVVVLVEHVADEMLVHVWACRK